MLPRDVRLMVMNCLHVETISRGYDLRVLHEPLDDGSLRWRTERLQEIASHCVCSQLTPTQTYHLLMAK
jgi:hypothetical protein